MNKRLISIVLCTLSSILIGVLSLFILYNARWIIGDDAMVVAHTGLGHFFYPSETITPADGRFFPLAYVIYNILPFLGLTSVNAHFALHTLIFVLFCVVSIWACRKVIDAKQLTWQDGVLILAGAVVCIARAYSGFLDAYSTIWVDYTLILIWALCCYYVHTKPSKAALIIGLLSVTYLTFCLETNFVFPLSYGILGLLLIRKNSTKIEKVYFWSLVGIGVVFLLLYFFICFIHIEEAYDGSHGQEVTMIGNSIKMFMAQKLLWLVLIIVCWRTYSVIAKKEEVEFWDLILLTGCAYCCGCAVMKLNWVLYYSLASLFMVTAIVYYLNKYLGRRWSWIVMLVFAGLYGMKVPKAVKMSNRDRMDSHLFMQTIKEQLNEGNTVYLYAPGEEVNSFDGEQRRWIYNAVGVFARYYTKQEDLQFEKIRDFKGAPGLYITIDKNEILATEGNNPVASSGVNIAHCELRHLDLWMVE